MPQWDQLGKKIRGLAHNASKKSERVVETAKLNAAINRLELDIEDIQYELGKAYYEEYFNASGTEFQNYVDQINELAAQIQEHNKKLLAFKNLQVCQACDSTEPLANEFCGKCGARLLGYKLEPKCEHCGAILDEGAIFCKECGTTVASFDDEEEILEQEEHVEPLPPQYGEE